MFASRTDRSLREPAIPLPTLLANLTVYAADLRATRQAGEVTSAEADDIVTTMLCTPTAELEEHLGEVSQLCRLLPTRHKTRLLLQPTSYGYDHTQVRSRALSA